jgi:uncharacterized protein
MTELEFVALAKSGDTDAVRAALHSSPEIVSAKEGGVSGLLWAVYYGHPQIARIIADARNGAVDIFEATALGDRNALPKVVTAENVNAFSDDGFTPLGLAAYFGHREIVEDLLKAGADPNIASKNPLGVIPLHSALSGRHKEIARALVEAGTDVNTPNKEGWFPLHYVAHSGDRETADYLTMKGANTSQVNNSGETPAMVARKLGHTDLADILE